MTTPMSDREAQALRHLRDELDLCRTHQPFVQLDVEDADAILAALARSSGGGERVEKIAAMIVRGFNLDEQDRPELDVAAARILAEAIDAALAALPPPAPSGEGEFIIAAAETVETADSVIQIMGDDVPEEWNTAYLAFCAARAALHAPAPSVPPGVGAVPGWPTGITHGELSDIRYGRTAPLPPGVVELKEAAEEVAHWLEALSGIVDWPDDGEPDLKALNCDAVLSMAMKGGRQTCNALRAAIAAVPIGG